MTNFASGPLLNYRDLLVSHCFNCFSACWVASNEYPNHILRFHRGIRKIRIGTGIELCKMDSNHSDKH